ncbi:ATP-binding protein [Algiphilus sp.]|uniref:sensor histidine kinase n=1 Tax=Algiphilus sp. TaxID=1872431 RepID=UPI0032EB74BF
MTADWIWVELPDTTATPRLEGSRLGNRPHGPQQAPVHWYRFHFTLADPVVRSLALYTPRYSDRARVYVNGSMIDRSFLDPDRIEHGWNRPLWTVVPRIALQAGRNEILIGVDSPYTGEVDIGRLRVGPPAALRDDYEWTYIVRVSTAQAGFWMLAGLALFSLGVWAVRRSERLHLLLGLGAAVFAVRMLHYFVVVPPISPDVFWWITTASLPWTMVFLFLFAFRYYGILRPRLARILLLMAALVTVAIAPGTGLDAYEVAPWVYLALLPLALFTAGLFVERAVRLRSAPPILLAAGYTTTIAVSWYDLAVMGHFVSLELPYLMPVGAVLMFLSFSLALGARYVEWLGEFEILNRTLEERVQERQAALESSFERLEALHREQALTEERQRLMREIHDGIGANLVTTLAAVEASDDGRDPRAANALRSAIADLKLTVDSLEPVDGDLLSLLGNLRYRLAPQLEHAGVRMQWEVEPLPMLDWLRAPQALHVLRIAQEAFSNLMQHAGARTVRVSTAVASNDAGDAEVVRIEFSDDGVGFAHGELVPLGKGLDNMAHRAAVLGGRLVVRSAPGAGTTICLELPVTEPRTAVTG